MADRDYYNVLGVNRSASADEIKKAYRKLAREFHPDLHPNDKTAESKFKEVQQAYDILGDEKKRQKYDKFGHAAFEGGFPEGGPGMGGKHYTWSSQGGPDVQFGFGDEGIDVNDILANLLREGAAGGQTGGPRGQRRRSAPAQGQDLETSVIVPFVKAVLGGELDVIDPRHPTKKLGITIPPGITEGAKLRLSGKGGAARGGGKPGDLLVNVQIEPHPYFTRKGDDIYVDVPITFAEAMLGAAIDVPTLEGTMIQVTVPAGTSSGQKLRLRGKGGKTKAGERADLFAVIKIVVPKKIDDADKLLLTQLAQKYELDPRKNAWNG